jgi:hypothetical protein
MKKNVACSECDKLLIPYDQDKRMGFCKGGCNIFRCGWCGNTIEIHWTYYKADSFWDWLVPKKIMQSVIHSPTALCRKCGRKYPSKTNMVKYLFWEAKVLWWRIGKRKISVDKSAEYIPKVA